jgi:VanZ family protein
MLKILLSEKFFKLYLLLCLLAIEFLATTKIHIEAVESIWDKANHFIAFFVLYVLLSFAYKKLNIITKSLLLLAFGLQIEIVQELIGRSAFSGLDILADSVGILIGIGVILVLKLKSFL